MEVRKFINEGQLLAHLQVVEGQFAEEAGHGALHGAPRGRLCVAHGAPLGEGLADVLPVQAPGRRLEILSFLLAAAFLSHCVFGFCCVHSCYLN